ncbi:LacI family DNA-binding transcriptional regulator [Marinomonas posidonica]|uniref:Transcriptional regulator, LacI family n=1 Tax=Marinomonas posidonica (strain CECT 7376 / NCIMB 14433 / IVIA-Po-181) TaxID=491952 RepID=F6CZ06_MARPP|nr:LacI family DNA-binding transcriptional regulator [Marinomonas posidonica]AEF53133.1 transcriptional regulator, LacI family [Marinomonas posidonica IVIA-Po-181]
MATIKDIARLSGAGASTVSRVINKSGYVSNTTRLRIEKAIIELGYTPNIGARTLRSGKSNLIGILVPSIKVDFFARLAHKLEQMLFAQGYQTMICSTAEDTKHEAKYIEMLLNQKVAGVMVASVGNESAAFTKLQNANIPVLALDRQLIGLDVPFVRADHFEGGRLAAEHLISLGHQSISIIGAPDQSEPVKLRTEGAIETCKKAGIKVPNTILGSKHSVWACESLANEALSFSPRPTAIIATSDIAAIGVLHAARELGINIPEDLSVTGFDDTPMASYVFPPITTIAQPIEEIAEVAIKTMISFIKKANIDINQKIMLPVNLKIRKSTIQNKQ